MNDENVVIELKEAGRVVHTFYPNRFTKSEVRVRFEFDEDDLFEVWAERGHLHIRSLFGMVVHPLVANEVAISTFQPVE